MSPVELCEHTASGWTPYTEAASTFVFWHGQDNAEAVLALILFLSILPGPSVDVNAAVLESCEASPTDLGDALVISMERLLFLFLPKELWIHIAAESDRYKRRLAPQTAAEIAQREQRLRATHPEYRPKSGV